MMIYFKMQKDVVRKLGFSGYQNCIAAIQMLTHGVVGDAVDEYMCIIESTCFEAMHMF